MKKILLLVGLTGFLMSCEQNEDIVQTPQKDGSIETSLSTKRVNNLDILTIEYKVWVKGKIDKKFTKIDTLSSLGTTKEEGEDKDGNLKEIVLPKDYEIYITVK